MVALLLDSGVSYAVAYLGAAKIGAVTAGINPRFGSREIAHIVASSGASLVVADREVPRGARAAHPDDLVASPGDVPRAPAHADDPVAIVYTSGTTGMPKGATYTAGAIEAVRRIESALDPEPHPKGLQGTPMAHMGYMTKIASTIDRVTTTVMMERWSARAALEAIERERLTHVGGVPTQLALMLMDPEFPNFDLSSLRSLLMGGAPAAPDLVRRVRQGFGVPVLVRYSCTELALGCGTRPGDPDRVVAQTVGRPLPEVDLRIVSQVGEGVGEVCIRSPAMMSGYWRDEAATRESIDAHGWFHTGDLGRLEGAGNLVLAGRAKEMYIRGGYNVYPVEVEAVLREHPKVGLAAVIGLPDPVLGERGLALVVPAVPGDPPEAEDLRRFVAERLADYKVPDLVEVREALPLTAMFKVDKRALAGERSSEG